MNKTRNNKQYKHPTIIMFMAIMIVISTGSALFAGPEVKAKSGAFAKSFLPTWERAEQYTLKVAEMMPEEHFFFKAHPEVQSFAQQLFHCVGGAFFFGSKVKGVEPPKERPKAEGKSKAEVIMFMKKAFAFAREAIANLSDEEAAKKIHVFGELHLTKMQVILAMRDHITHHRGQLVLFLRLKGLKPPQFVGW
jgi:uncharacterized damage-inducible protein DinB